MIPISCLLSLLLYVHMEYSCQASPVVGVLLNPPYLPWSVYVYGPNGFSREHDVGRNTNVIGYSFPEGT